MDAVLLELQILIGVGEAAGAPMLLDNNFAGLRRELSSELATPRAVLECFSRPRRLLNRRNVRPGLIVAWMVSMMHCKENPQLRLPCRIEDLLHMRNAVVRFGNSFDARPDLAALGNALGQKQKFLRVRTMSALPLKTEIDQQHREVCFVPNRYLLGYQKTKQLEPLQRRPA